MSNGWRKYKIQKNPEFLFSRTALSVPVSEMMTFKTVQSKKEEKKATHTHTFVVAKPLIFMIQQVA